MKTSIVLSAIIVSVMALITSAAVFTVADGINNQQNPAISGKKVVYEDSSTINTFAYRIMLKDIDTGITTMLSPNPDPLIYQNNPDIDGNIVIWQEGPEGINCDIIGYNLTTNQRFDICTDSNPQENAAISGNLVVWQENGDIYGKYIDQPNKFPICTAENYQYQPDVSGSIVVWQDFRGVGGDIYGKDVSGSNNEFLICDATNDQTMPKISGNLVVWQDNRTNSYTDIYGKYLNQQSDFAICTESGKQNRPEVLGDIVVWHDTRFGQTDHRIYYKNVNDAGSGTLVESSYSYTYDYPAISSGLIVFQGDISNYNIYGSYIPMPSTITVENPQTGDEYLAGKQSLIEWESSIMPSGTVKIEYSADNGANYTQIIAETGNDGQYLWDPIANIDSEDCIIKITDPTYPTSFDTSGVFSIIICNPNLTADLTGDCVVDMEDFAHFTTQWLTNGKN